MSGIENNQWVSGSRIKVNFVKETSSKCNGGFIFQSVLKRAIFKAANIL